LDTVLNRFQETIRSALERKTRLCVRGSGSKDFLGYEVTGDVFDTRDYCGIVDYDPGELVITARCGTRLSEIEATLAAQGQMLAFEPPYFGPNATLGGCIAAGLSGPRRAYAGAVRDFLLGIRLLNGRGEDLSFGGRVMKNVAGYDVTRLIAGSLGTLGVILEASIKVLPVPQNEITLNFEMDATTAIEKQNRWVVQGIPISASCHVDNLLAIRVTGSENRLTTIKQNLGGDVVTDSALFWRSVKEHTHNYFKSDLPLWRLSIKSSAPQLKHSGKQLIEWNGSLRWYQGELDTATIRRLAENSGGHATLFRGKQDGVEIFHPLAGLMFNLHKRLKQAFDPLGIFNPGRMYREL
jgi:glycolate oxidase FAD binding subunit